MSSQRPDHARVIPLRPGDQDRKPPQPQPQHREPPHQEPQGREPQGREPLWRHMVGDVLRHERHDQQRTLKDVAEEARISMPYLSEIERGRKEPSSEVLAAAARALGLSLADLLIRVHGELAEVAQARRMREATPVRSQMRSHQVELSLAA